MIATRSPIARLGVRAATPLALMVGIYLLFAGHNRPGGGFAAGLVFGAVITLRTIAGIAAPRGANRLVAVGVGVVGIVALAPLLWGDTLLDQAIVSTTLPLLGKVKTGTALVFDLGVTAIVVGLIIALLEGLNPTMPTQTAGSGRTDRPVS